MIGSMQKAGLQGTGPMDTSMFWTPIAAAVLPVPRGNLLFLKFNSTGNCADYKFYAFGSRNHWGLRDELLDNLCVGELEIKRSGNDVPSLVLPLATMVAVLRWTGAGWEDPSKFLIRDYEATHGGR